MLVAARACQGAFGALLAPAALSLLTTTFEGTKDRGKAFGVFGAIAGAGGAVGLLLGGLLTQYLDWRWCLYVNLVFAAIAGAGAVVLLRRQPASRRPRLDLPGLAAEVGGMFCIVYGFSNAASDGWHAPATWGFLAAGAVLLTAFGYIETRARQPLLPLRIVLDRNRAAAYLSILITGAGMFGIFLFLTYYLQETLGFSPVMAGVAFLPMAGAIIVSANLANIVLLPRIGPRWLVAPGMLAAAAGLAWLTRIGVHSSYAADVLPPLLLTSAGLGFVMSPSMNTGTAGVAPSDAGAASAMVNTGQQVGGSIGTSLLNTMAASAAASYLASHLSPRLMVGGHPAPALAELAQVHSYTTAFWWAAGMFAAGSVLAALLFRRGAPAAPASTGGPDTMSPQDTGICPAARPAAAFDPLTALDDLLSTVSLARAATGGAVSIAGQDPIVPAAHRLGACIGIPIMANAVAAVAFHRHRGGPGQDLELDLRQAIHGINPGAFWHPTLNGAPAPHPLVLDNPFLLTPYRTADGRWVMASGVYPHLAARWCRFLDVPPDAAKVAAAIQRWDAFELEADGERRGPSGVRHTRARWNGWLTRRERSWRASRSSAWSASATPRHATSARRSGRSTASASCRSPTPSRARSWAGPWPSTARTCSCATRPNDYEHEFIYAEANLGSRSAYVDLANPAGQERAAALLADADIVVNNHRAGSLERRGLEPRQLAERYPGLVYVSVTCYGSRGPWAAARRLRHERIGCLRPHDHRRNRGRAQAPRHRDDQRLHHRLPGSSRRRRGPGQARRRGRLLARHREPHPHRDVVRVARPGQPCAGRLRRRAPSPRAGPLRRPQPARRRPHARPAGPILLHRARLASTPARPPRLRPRSMAELTRPGLPPGHLSATKVRPHEQVNPDLRTWQACWAVTTTNEAQIMV